VRSHLGKLERKIRISDEGDRNSCQFTHLSPWKKIGCSLRSMMDAPASAMRQIGAHEISGLPHLQNTLDFESE
jgi:hypothetical protein